MKLSNKIHRKIVQTLAVCMVSILTIAPMEASASVLKIGSRNREVKEVQSTLKDLGYFKYPKITGYYGKVTANAVKKFQKANGLSADGIIGKHTRKAMKDDGQIQSLSLAESSTSVAKKVSSTNMGSIDWFKRVIHIWDRGVDATVLDVDTGKSFKVKRTYGTNHADVEPLTRKDANTIKNIWGGWTWERRAVVVMVDDYILAASMTSVPHAGVDSKPATSYVSGRSGGYGWGTNLDAVKNNGVSGVMDIHFKNSRTHSSNTKQSSHQNMIAKAAKYIKNNY